MRKENKKMHWVPRLTLHVLRSVGCTSSLENGIALLVFTKDSVCLLFNKITQILFPVPKNRKNTMPFFSGGFTLVETLLAIAILSMAVIAPLSIASHGLSAATTAKDRFIATALAREALEYIRNARDSNRVLLTDTDDTNDPGDWLYGLEDCLGDFGELECVIDTLADNNTNFKINARGSHGVLRVDTSQTYNTGIYGSVIGGCHGSAPGCWSDSKFTRFVWMEHIVDGREVKVTAKVEWKTLFSTKEVVITEYLLKW